MVMYLNLNIPISIMITGTILNTIIVMFDILDNFGGLIEGQKWFNTHSNTPSDLKKVTTYSDWRNPASCFLQSIRKCNIRFWLMKSPRT